MENILKTAFYWKVIEQLNKYMLLKFMGKNTKHVIFLSEYLQCILHLLKYNYQKRQLFSKVKDLDLNSNFYIQLFMKKMQIEYVNILERIFIKLN